MNYIRSAIFVSDLDGTLLDDCERVSPRSVELLNELAARGVRFTCATARTPATVQPILRSVRPTLPAIVMTGAAMWDRAREQYLETHFIAPEAAAAAMRICRSHGINPFVYSMRCNGFLHVWHNGECNLPERRFIDERRRLPHKKFHLDEPAGLADCIPSTILIFAIGPREPLMSAAELIQREVDCSVSAYLDIYTPDTGILEVFAPGISKAAAVERLKMMTGAERVVVFGDNLNDIPMMEVADESYAVANALDAVKEAATGVIGSNLHDAVPRKIMELVNNS